MDDSRCYGVLCTLCDFPVSKDSRWHKQIKGSLSPRLDCSAVVISHCNLKLLGSGDSPISDSQATGTTAGARGVFKVTVFNLLVRTVINLLPCAFILPRQEDSKDPLDEFSQHFISIFK
ncbi:uncharacterized protein isoform X1 [Macaca fascicularis]|uniref:uncharacterized protein isoform X1 n=1 Tax=Macaca fascicularis TaxID=9541 RepID=UPI003D155795